MVKHITLSCHGSFYATEGNCEIPSNLEVRYYVNKGQTLSVTKAEAVWEQLKNGVQDVQGASVYTATSGTLENIWLSAPTPDEFT